MAQSEFLNTSQKTVYVGTAKCAECHEDERHSHLKTQHSRALRDVASFPQPPDGEVEPRLSGRTYRIYRQGGQMRHREAVRMADGERELADFAPRYVIGSGTHSLTYLIADGEFLVESPVTWFTPAKKWDMSPGYEKSPDQPGFSRPINTTCVNCHSGGAIPIDHGLYRFAIRELAIGCERCHGPGSSHVAKWEGSEEISSGADLTIVNPDNLDRDRVNAICSQCHLEGAMRVGVRGRDSADFRPGMRFEDFEMAYVLTSANNTMKVVGHVEQMRQSRCYSQSNSLTCVTCHDPHDVPDAAERVAYFRNKCLQCHAVESCGMPRDERLAADSQDDCSRCHMPKSPVEVVHVSFTHHRIGIHDTTPPPDQTFQDLVPLLDDSHLSLIDRDRCRGLAYLELSSLETDDLRARYYGRRAQELLQDVAAQGLHDPDVDAALARIAFAERRFDKALQLARSALDMDNVSPSVRVDALDTLSSSYFEQGDLSAAAPVLDSLLAARRSAEDWRRRALCYFTAGDRAAALKAAREAVRIAPHRADLQQELASLLEELGDHAAALPHFERARAIQASVVPSATRHFPH